MCFPWPEPSLPTPPFFCASRLCSDAACLHRHRSSRKKVFHSQALVLAGDEGLPWGATRMARADVPTPMLELADRVGVDLGAEKREAAARPVRTRLACDYRREPLGMGQVRALGDLARGPSLAPELVATAGRTDASWLGWLPCDVLRLCSVRRNVCALRDASGPSGALRALRRAKCVALLAADKVLRATSVCVGAETTTAVQVSDLHLGPVYERTGAIVAPHLGL